VTDANKRANVASELGRADESMRAARVLVDAALLHDAESRLCQGFLDRARGTIAGFLG